MKLQRILFIITISICSPLIIAKKHEFSNLVVFGDSLSDVGNIRYLDYKNEISYTKMVAGDNLVYNEYLSKLFTGKKIYPSKYGGTNYAYTSATINPSLTKKKYNKDLSILNVFNKYILTNKIDSNNVYIVWGGGNDIRVMFFLNFSLRSYLHIINRVLKKTKFIFNVNNNPFDLDDFTKKNSFKSNDYVSDMAKILIDNGAKYVIVPNLFDTSFTPFQIFALQKAFLKNISFLLGIEDDILKLDNDILGLNNDINIVESDNDINILGLENDNIIIKYLLPFGLNRVIFKVIYSLLDWNFTRNYEYLNSKNNIPNTIYKGAGKDFIIKRRNEFYAKYGFIGRIVIKIIENTHYLSKNFNYFLEQRLQELDDKIIYIDVFSLLNEIIDNPKFYGIDDILLPICSGFVMYDISECRNEKKGIYHSEKTYLWSDVVHPSPFMHMVYAQYMISVFNAPVLVSSISRHLSSINDNAKDYIFNQVAVNASNNLNNLHKFIPLVSISGSLSKIGSPYDYDSRYTNTSSLNLGFTYGVNEKLLLGTMLSASLGSFRPYDNFKYRYHSEIINLFAKYNITNNLWLYTDFNLGSINANNIRRTIILGKGKHIEKGSTSGRSIGISLTTGYDLLYRDNITITPYISLNLDNYRISGFRELDDRSTSMRYGRSSTTNKEIKLALRLTKHSDTLNSFIELGLIQPLHNQPIKIKSGLKSIKISFVREIEANTKTNLNLALGLNKKLKSNLNINASINYKINKDKNQQLNYAIGINKRI